MSANVKKCLLIGINYTGTTNELRGCINDTINLQNFLIEQKMYTKEEMTFMCDNSPEKLKPTKQNICQQLNELVDFARKHENEKVKLFLSYSGHGSYLPDWNGDELDGHDEVLCPIDCDVSGYIIDDYIKSSFIDKLGANVDIFILIDACHSGTMCDLKLTYPCNDTTTYIETRNEMTKCNVIMISGCRDEQTSCDAFLPIGKCKYQGAMTVAFVRNYRKELSIEQIIKNMRQWLTNNNFDQEPQLSSGKRIDIKLSILV